MKKDGTDRWTPDQNIVLFARHLAAGLKW